MNGLIDLNTSIPTLSYNMEHYFTQHRASSTAVAGPDGEPVAIFLNRRLGEALDLDKAETTRNLADATGLPFFIISEKEHGLYGVLRGNDAALETGYPANFLLTEDGWKTFLEDLGRRK